MQHCVVTLSDTSVRSCDDSMVRPQRPVSRTKSAADASYSTLRTSLATTTTITAAATNTANTLHMSLFFTRYLLSVLTTFLEIC